MKPKKRNKPGSAVLNRAAGRLPAPVLLLVAMGLIAYWNSFDVPLVFDDLVSIQRNASVRFGDYLNPSIFFRGILYITFTLNYMVGGQDVFGYHLVNLLLHIANGILIYFIARQIFEKIAVPSIDGQTYAFVAAAFFLAHPLQTESVTYISSRSELLSTFFYAGALLLFIRRPPERIGFVFSLVICGFFLLGIGAKETVISLPAALVLYDFLFLANSRPRQMLVRWRFYATFILGAVIVGYRLVTSVLVGSIGGNLEGHLSPWHYFLTQIRVLVWYIRLTFLPTGLNLDHDFQPSISPFEPRVIASATFLLLIVMVGWRMRRRQPVIAFSIFWFFLTLAPTSSFVPLLDVIFEHRMYLPMVGICLSLPLLVHLVLGWFRARFGFRVATAHMCFVLIALAGIGTHYRNEVWRDVVTLWKDVVSKSPKKVRAHSSLAFAYYNRQDYENALDATMEGIRNIPDQKKIFYGQLGNLYLKLGRFQEAVGVFEEATTLAETPVELSLAYNNLGFSYQNMWSALQARRRQLDTAQFEQEKERLLSRAENACAKSKEASTAIFWNVDCYCNVVYARAVRLEEVRAALSGKNDLEASYCLGIFKIKDGEATGRTEPYRDAAEYFQQAESFGRREKLIYFNHAYALEKLGEIEQAVGKYLEALRIDPLFVAANTNLGLAYMKKMDFQAAISSFAEVVRLEPNNFLAHLNMAKIYIQLGQGLEARKHLSLALNVSPGHQEAMQVQQVLLSRGL